MTVTPLNPPAVPGTTTTPNSASWQQASASAESQIQQQGVNAAITVLGNLGMQMIGNLMQEESDLSSP